MDDKSPIGRVYVDYSTVEFRVIDISILPEFQNQGIGKRILQDVIHRGNRQGVPVRMRVNKNNPALNLYQQMGFKIIADEKIVWHLEMRPNGDTRDDT